MKLKSGRSTRSALRTLTDCGPKSTAYERIKSTSITTWLTCASTPLTSTTNFTCARISRPRPPRLTCKTSTRAETRRRRIGRSAKTLKRKFRRYQQPVPKSSSGNLSNASGGISTKGSSKTQKRRPLRNSRKPKRPASRRRNARRETRPRKNRRTTNCSITTYSISSTTLQRENERMNRFKRINPLTKCRQQSTKCSSVNHPRLSKAEARYPSR